MINCEKVWQQLEVAVVVMVCSCVVSVTLHSMEMSLGFREERVVVEVEEKVLIVVEQGYVLEEQ